MKGQLGLDYYLSLILFALFSSYIVYQIMGITPAYLREIRNERLRSEAYQISEMLVNNPGEPINWHELPPEQIKRVGLSDEEENRTNLLSREKIEAFNLNCSNYQDIVGWVGADPEIQFSVTLINTTGYAYISCFPTVTIARAAVMAVRRVVAIDSGDWGELVVQVW
jgi:hypothetical protein